MGRKRTLTQMIHRRGLALFLVIVFATSWVAGMGWVIVTSSWVGGRGPFAAMYLPALVVVTGPAAGALFVTGLTHGGRGVLTLVGRVRPRSSHWRWYLGLPLVAVALNGGAYLMAGVSPAALRDGLATGGYYWLAAHFAVQVLVVGIGEELGWRGWLLPYFAESRTLWTATWCTTALWALWHVPKFSAGWAVALVLLTQAAALGLVLSWLWARLEGAILPLAVAHGAANAPVFFAEHRVTMGPDQLVAGWAYAVGMYAVLAVGLSVRSDLWRREQTVPVRGGS